MVRLFVVIVLLVAAMAASAEVAPWAWRIVGLDPPDSQDDGAEKRSEGGAPAAQPNAGGPGYDIPIVYSRSLINKEPFTAKDGSQVDEYGASTYDSNALPDTTRIWQGMVEADLVYRDAGGNETVIHNCTGDDAVLCAALDGKVSPNAQWVAYWTAEADKTGESVWTYKGQVPRKPLRSKQSRVRLYNLLTGERRDWGATQGTFDLGPEWINDTTIVFSSNRAKQRPVYLRGKSPPYAWAMQRYVAHWDGSNAVRIGAHDDIALHTLVLKNGNLAFSQWRVDEKLGHDQGTGNVTLTNEFWVSESRQSGAGEFTRLNAHGMSIKDSATNTNSISLLALHFFGQRGNGNLLVSDYYRGRHAALGTILEVESLPPGVEGAGGSLFPRVINLTPWAQEADNPTFKDAHGLYMGNTGYPVGLPGNRIMLTHGQGYCYDELAWSSANKKGLKGRLGCNLGIFVMTKIPSEHPSDLVPLVDTDVYHEFAADVALPYSAVYGQATPEQQVEKITLDEAGEKICTLQVINVFQNRLHRGDPSKPCTKLASCVDPGRKIEEISKVAVYHATPNFAKQDNKNMNKVPWEGHEFVLLGYAIPEQDGSMALRVPCDTPLKIRGVDRDGTPFVRDQIKHSLPPGTTTTCVGCHGGHTEKEYEAIVGQMTVEERFSKTLAGGKAPQKLQR